MSEPFPLDWKETVLRYAPTERIRVNSHEEVASLLLRGYIIEPEDWANKVRDCGNRQESYIKQIDRLQ